MRVDPLKTNVYVRSLATPGLVPSVIKVLAVTGVSSYPVQIPVISYQGSASPFLNANVTNLGAGYFGYVLNNGPNQTVDVYITTNQPNNLIWTGSINNTWDTSTRNWVTAVGGVQTNFNLGDAVTFNDSSIVTNVNIDGSVVPSQTGIGVTISNSVNQYTFSGGTIAGTAQISKLGTNILEMDATEQGPISVLAGSLVGNGAVGTTTLASNVVMTYSRHHQWRPDFHRNGISCRWNSYRAGFNPRWRIGELSYYQHNSWPNHNDGRRHFTDKYRRRHYQCWCWQGGNNSTMGCSERCHACKLWHY